MVPSRTLLVALALCLAPSAAAAQSVSSIRITPENAHVVVGESTQFRAVALDAEGRELPNVTVNWGAAPFEIAFAEQNGTIHAVRQGEIHVLAFAGGQSASVRLVASPKPPASLEVSAARNDLVVGGATVLRATAYTEDGEELHDARVRYESSAPRIARVDDGGVVVGLAPGSARITARAGDASETIDVRVIANPVARLEVAAPTSSTRTGEVVRFTARALNAAGSAVPDAPLRWSVDRAGAQVFDDGAFVAERPGSYLVTALAGNVASTASITVEQRVNPRRLELVGNRVYSDIEAAEHWAINDVLYVSTISDRVYTYDISEPSNPVLVDSIQVDAGVINDVSTTRDGRIGVITREGARSRRNGIVFLDLSDPLHPTVLSEYTTTVTGGVHSAFVDEPYVYLTDDATGSMRVIDFSDVRNPREIARWQPEAVRGVEGIRIGDEPLGITVGRMLHDVRVEDGIAYLSYWRHGLIMLDVGNGIADGSPSNPQEITRYTYNVAQYYPADHIAGTHTAWRDGNYVFVGDEVFPPLFGIGEEPIAALGHMHVLDVTDIRNPVKVAEYRVPIGGVHNFWVEDGVLYLGAYNGGIRAIDVSGELRGRLDLQGRELGVVWTGHPEGKIPNEPMVWGAQPHNGVVYATDMNSGLWVARLSPAPVP